MNELIKKTKKLKPQDILSILEDYRLSKKSIPQRTSDKSILISIKIPQSLLEDFKKKCSDEGLKYQTQIKALMKSWL